jgi:Transposase IS116/IS110/IS902 family
VLYEDWQTKTRQIQRVEQDLAGILVKTPYLLLLSHPGINVVTASELAGEMGPREHYAHAKAISGRAGLFPSRYQSDEVDRADGPLARFRNARLRAAWMRVADCLIKHNAHYRGKSELWKQRGVAPRDIHSRVANRVTRTVFQMVSGRKLYHHPSRLERSYVLDKLLDFHKEHATAAAEILGDLNTAAAQIPKSEQAAEAQPLQERRRKACRSRRKGPQAIGEILLVVLARLQVPTRTCPTRARDNAVVPLGSATRWSASACAKPVEKAWRSVAARTPDTETWGFTPRIYQVGEKSLFTRQRLLMSDRCVETLAFSKTAFRGRARRTRATAIPAFPYGSFFLPRS